MAPRREGGGATIYFDLWERALSFVPGQERPDWAPVGRCFWYLLRHGRVFLPALAFGIANIAAAWFLLFPGMGLGWAAGRTPDPNKKRMLGPVEHTFFAVGLYGTALLLNLIVT